MLEALDGQRDAVRPYGSDRHGLVTRRQWQENLLFLRQQHDWLLLGGGVNTLVCDVVQPATDVGIGSRDVEHQARALECRRQRRDEALLEIAIEALDLALGLGAIRSTHARPEAELVGQREQVRMPAMLARAIGIALDDDGLGIIEQQLVRHSAEVDQGLANTGEPGLAVLAIEEADVGGAAIAERGNQGLERLAASADGGEVDLHLLAGAGLEAHDRVSTPWLARANERLQLADAAGVTLLADLAEQNRRRNPEGTGRLDALAEVGMERLQFGRPWGTGRVLGCDGPLAQVAPDGVAGQAQLAGDGLDGEPLPEQNVDLH